MPKLRDQKKKTPRVVVARGSQEDKEVTATCREPDGTGRGDPTDLPPGVHRNVARSAGPTWALRADAAIMRLEQLFPRCFFIFDQRRRPLKLGIYNDVSKAAPTFDPVELSIALKRYVGSPCYLARTRVGEARIDLDGNAAGSVTEHEAEYAARVVKNRAGRIKPLPKPKPNPKRMSIDDLRAAARLRKRGRLPPGGEGRS